MTHTLIENSAPRPQLYQQVRPAEGSVSPHSPHWSLSCKCSRPGVPVLMASQNWSPCIVLYCWCLHVHRFLLSQSCQLGNDLWSSSCVFFVYVSHPLQMQRCLQTGCSLLETRNCVCRSFLSLSLSFAVTVVVPHYKCSKASRLDRCWVSFLISKRPGRSRLVCVFFRPFFF